MCLFSESACSWYVVVPNSRNDAGRELNHSDKITMNLILLFSSFLFVLKPVHGWGLREWGFFNIVTSDGFSKCKVIGPNYYSIGEK